MIAFQILKATMTKSKMLISVKIATRYLMIKSVQQIIDESLVRVPHEHSGKFKPSNFGRCYRLQIWARRDFPESNPPSPRELRLFKCGNHFEDWVKSLILQDGTGWVDGNTEEQVIECEDVKGFCDLIRSNEIADIKSQNSKAFWWKAKEIKMGKDIRDIVHHNWMQVMYYVREKQKQFGRLIFISKDDLCISEYIQSWDDYWRGEIDMELNVLRDYWADKILPPAEPRAWKSECDYCQFAQAC